MILKIPSGPGRSQIGKLRFSLFCVCSSWGFKMGSLNVSNYLNKPMAFDMFMVLDRSALDRRIGSGPPDRPGSALDRISSGLDRLGTGSPLDRYREGMKRQAP